MWHLAVTHDMSATISMSAVSTYSQAVTVNHPVHLVRSTSPGLRTKVRDAGQDPVMVSVPLSKPQVQQSRQQQKQKNIHTDLTNPPSELSMPMPSFSLMVVSLRNLPKSKDAITGKCWQVQKRHRQIDPT